MNVEVYDRLNENILSILESLEKEIFTDHYQAGRLTDEAKSHDGIICIVAYDGNKPVGFKLGYQLKPDIFYSWLGGILLEYRKKGLASEMMKRQHQHIKDLGYRCARTNGRNQYRDMLILNLKMGFDIIGTHLVTDEGNISISLEKKLS